MTGIIMGGVKLAGKGMSKALGKARGKDQVETVNEKKAMTAAKAAKSAFGCARSVGCSGCGCGPVFSAISAILGTFAVPVLICCIGCCIIMALVIALREQLGTWGTNYEMARHIGRVQQACGTMPSVLWDKALAANGITIQRSGLLQGATKIANGIFGTDLPVLDSYDADPVAAEQTIAAYAECGSTVQYETLTQVLFQEIIGDVPGTLEFISNNKEALSN